MTNTNIIAPEGIFYQDGSDEMRQLLGILTGHDCIPCEGSTGSAPDGPHEEGDVDYYDCSDGLGYTLHYDFEDAGYGMCRLLGHSVERNEYYDHYFDVTRERLEEVLRECATHANGPCRDLLVNIGGKFGIRVDG